MDLVSIIVFLVVVGLVFWVVRTLADAFDLPKQITSVVNVVLVVIVVLYLLRWVAGPFPLPMFR
jgi:uncharacterized membrane protein